MNYINLRKTVAIGNLIAIILGLVSVGSVTLYVTKAVFIDLRFICTVKCFLSFFKGIEKTEENKIGDKDAHLKNEKASTL